MPKHHLGFISSDGAERDAVLERYRGSSNAMRSDVGYASAD